MLRARCAGRTKGFVGNGRLGWKCLQQANFVGDDLRIMNLGRLLWGIRLQGTATGHGIVSATAARVQNQQLESQVNRASGGLFCHPCPGVSPPLQPLRSLLDLFCSVHEACMACVY